MDWDQLAIVGQLVTGVATLAVAVFLWKQLKVQHRDSEREFAFANETKQQDLIISFYTDESTADLMWEAASDWDSLSPTELHRFRWLQSQTYLHQLNAWRLKRDGDDHSRFRNQWTQMLEHPGQRRFHEKWGRRLTERDPKMSEMVEEIYHELENQAA